MTRNHAALLYFDGRKEAAKKRIQKLKAASLVTDRRRPYRPSVLSLSKRGFQTLKKAGYLPDIPELIWANVQRRTRLAASALAHQLLVMDVKASLSHALARDSRHELVEFNAWPLFCQFTAIAPRGTTERNRRITIKPDGLLCVHETAANQKHIFFLEVDRSAESQDILTLHAQCYHDYFRHGGFAESCGARRDEYKKFPFRVLMVCQNAERRNNTAEKLLILAKPILRQVWLTTIDEVRTNPLAAIWVTPHAYRTATSGTEYDVTRIREQRRYRRSLEREKMIEASVVKRVLLASP
jgi:hypothetical protein